LIRRSIRIAGHVTSVTLELEFWETLQEIALADGTSVASLIRQINEDRIGTQYHNLSSAIRIFILKRLKEKVRPER